MRAYFLYLLFVVCDFMRDLSALSVLKIESEFSILNFKFLFVDTHCPVIDKIVLT